MKQFNELDLKRMIAALEADYEESQQLKEYFQSKQQYSYTKKIKTDYGLIEAELDKIIVVISNLMRKIASMFAGVEMEMYHTQEEIEDKILLHSNKLSLIEVTVKGYREQIRDIKLQSSEKSILDVRNGFTNTVNRLKKNGYSESHATVMSAKKLLNDGINAAVVDELVSERDVYVELDDLVKLEGAINREKANRENTAELECAGIA